MLFFFLRIHINFVHTKAETTKLILNNSANEIISKCFSSFNLMKVQVKELFMQKVSEYIFPIVFFYQNKLSQITDVQALRTNLSKMNNSDTLKVYQPRYLFVICNLSSSGQPLSARFNRVPCM